MMTREQIIARIEKLQITRLYADKQTAAEITQEIERLLGMLEIHGVEGK